MRSYSKNRECNGAKAKSANSPLPLVVHASPLDPARGLIRIGPAVFPCALGSAGIAAIKREGDGATPLAAMPVLGGWFRGGSLAGSARRAPCRLAPMRADLGWCDDPRDRNYNRPVRLPYPASHERMRRADRLYDVVIVLGWNVVPRRRGRGSAIFLHIARPGLRPTEGCVAVTPPVMRRLLQHLQQGSVIKTTR